MSIGKMMRESADCLPYLQNILGIFCYIHSKFYSTTPSIHTRTEELRRHHCFGTDGSV